MFFRICLAVLFIGITFLFWNAFSFPYETPKVFFFLFGITVIGWLLGIHLIKEQKISFPKIHKALLYFFLFILAANIFSFLNSVDMGRSFFGSYFRHQGVFLFFHYLLLFLVTFTVFQKKDWNVFTVLFAGISMILFGIGLWEFFVSKDLYFAGRISATLGQPVFLGQFIVLIFPLLLSAFLNSHRKILWTMPLISLIFILILTVSRGALLGLLIGGIVYAISYAWKFRRRWIFSVIGSTFFLLLVGFSLVNVFADASFVQENFVLRRFTYTYYHSVQPIKTRWEIWKGTVSLVKDHFLFGVGQDTFDLAFEPYQSDALRKFPELFADRAHNILLDVFATYGIFGFLAYFGFFFFSIFYGFQFFRKEKLRTEALTVLGFLASFIAFFVALQFNFLVTVHHVFFWALFAIFFVMISRKSVHFQWKFPLWLQLSLISLITVIAGVDIFFFQIPLLLSEKL